MRRRLRSRNLALLAAGLLAAAAVSAAAEGPGPARREHRELGGLREPAQIIVDFWGIPHIYAQNARDLFFLQGYNAARDRLWQIDLWRKRGLGLLARDFGPDYVAQDRAARMFLYRGDMEREWEAYGPNAHALAEAFVAGLNAFIREVRDGPGRCRRSSASLGPSPTCGAWKTSSESAATA